MDRGTVCVFRRYSKLNFEETNKQGDFMDKEDREQAIENKKLPLYLVFGSMENAHEVGPSSHFTFSKATVAKALSKEGLAFELNKETGSLTPVTSITIP